MCSHLGVQWHIGIWVRTQVTSDSLAQSMKNRLRISEHNRLHTIVSGPRDFSDPSLGRLELFELTTTWSLVPIGPCHCWHLTLSSRFAIFLYFLHSFIRSLYRNNSKSILLFDGEVSNFRLPTFLFSALLFPASESANCCDLIKQFLRQFSIKVKQEVKGIKKLYCLTNWSFCGVFVSSGH